MRVKFAPVAGIAKGAVIAHNNKNYSELIQNSGSAKMETQGFCAVAYKGMSQVQTLWNKYYCFSL